MAAKHDYAIGIDLGTSNSCVGVVRNGRVEIIVNEHGDRLTPSFVAFTEDERLIGESAKLQRTMNPANTVYEVKRLIGRKFSDEAVQKKLPHLPYRVVDDSGNPKICVRYRATEKIFTPEEISAMVLAKIKETAETFLGCEVRRAVITVPAYFADSQRQATIDAGTIAGLQVLKIINEPTAAAIAYGEDTNVTEETNILIFDFGGGTFDVAFLTMKKGHYDVKSIEGNSQLGGRDLDSRIVRYLIGEFMKKTGLDVTQDPKALAKITRAAENTKINLSCQMKDHVKIESLCQGKDMDLVFSRNRFELLCADIFDKTMQCVDTAISNSGVTSDKINEVVLVGGSAWIPKLRKMLEEKFPGKEIKRTINPAEAVAYGAAIQAAMLNNDRSVEDIQLTDVTPLSLGVQLTGNVMSTIIKRNTKIPASYRRNYTTICDFQKGIRFSVYEGENNIATQNNLLGVFAAEGIEIAPAGVPSVDVTFSLDENCILNVTAVDQTTGGGGHMAVSLDKGRLKREAIEDMERRNRALTNASTNLKDTIIKKKNLIERKMSLKKISQKGYEKMKRICEEAEFWLEAHTDATKAEYDAKEQQFNETFSELLEDHGY
ncbi:hypothetical protein HAZT_HAZT004032 [Hyalella azteca]|uniref:Heat shock 70 kDa protein n=1 Tax=Hyalella azteca TaxID=294128 RepID=A0A6A0HF50_HYAAZ|nr:heat shock 70 kDa protein [Hyalella azteca]XP_047736801.1 heat shock 70 kDa protein [Hyalella azteca]KAA0203771.1 hypothetical protein HAZT_HAZT004032 [Hyalella azteca]